MEYSNGYPCLYGLSTDSLSIENEGKMIPVIKNGTTWHVANRKSAAITYLPEMPYYTYILVLSKDSFKEKSDLYILDSEFVEFIKKKEFGQYYIQKGGGVEWFDKSCPFDYMDLRLEFLKEKGIPVVKILKEDPFPTRPIEEIDENDLFDLLKEEHTTKRKKLESLFEKFCRFFLKGRSIRRIQTELWNIFSSLADPSKEIQYKGIVQWPTGCGKTIAILMMILLSKEYCHKRGKYYRGLFVSPKNDILDTISKHFDNLKYFGIEVLDGSNAKLSKLSIPVDRHCLIMACHSALLTEKGMKSFPPLNHIHYDEVHRITGEMYFNLMNEMIIKWKTNFLTGTSATPKTTSPDQHRKLKELFGDPMNILHKCDVSEAVEEGWIAPPRFHVRILEKNDRGAVLESFVDCCVELVLQKGKGGKSIYYIESSMEEVRYAFEYAKKKYPTIRFYTAIDGERTDSEFLEAELSSIPHMLFACQRYREGSDIPGLEITGKLMGDTTSAHNLIQISGRALRKDYPDKEGWCMIAKPCEEGTTIDDVFDSILLEILDYLGDHNKVLGKSDVVKLVKTYFGDLSILGSRCSLNETIHRIEAAYNRIQFTKRTPKERYSLIQSYNKELGLCSKSDYEASRNTHPRFIKNPREYFSEYWTCWYDFLGVDTSRFPSTKSEWISICRLRNIHTWEQYDNASFDDLPSNPGEMYPEYLNWDHEFGIEDEIVW
jgi:hypothetical protein